ncbi:hypothetical protein BKA82DRAFT_106332, partial [Pisolithus tinctorius]
IRIHALTLLGVTDYKYLANVKCALSKDEVEAFEQDLPGAPKVTATKFMLDCMGDRDSSFNHEAISVFTDDFIDKLLKSCLDAMVDHPTLQKHVCLVAYLGMQGVSSDESEDEHTRTIDYPCIYPRWRSLSLAMIMWQADEVIEENAKIPIGKQKKSGTQLCNRPHSNKFNDNTAAPPGLPRNCYDVKWLASLPSRTLKCLRIQESTYAF